MKLNEYQELAQRTANPELTQFEKIENGLMGCCGEAGEAIDILKKYRFQNHELDREKLIYELGDILWYLAQSAVGLGVDLEFIAVKNIEKLMKRYPVKFNAEQSINRDDDK